MIVLKSPDGKLEIEPDVSVIESEDGVYLSYDLKFNPSEYNFKPGYEVVGVLNDELEAVDDPGETWLSELKRRQ